MVGVWGLHKRSMWHLAVGAMVSILYYWGIGVFNSPNMGGGY